MSARRPYHTRSLAQIESDKRRRAPQITRDLVNSHDVGGYTDIDSAARHHNKNPRTTK